MLQELRMACWAGIMAISAPALAQINSAFTYQGELQSGNAAANGPHDMRFRLYDSLGGITQIGTTQCLDNIAVSEGRFSVELDFGAVFGGALRYLEIDVRPDSGMNCSNGAGFVTLGPRQKLSTSPYAAYSLLSANSTNAAIAANATLLNNQSASFYTNAANLTGTVADSRLSGNVTTLGGTQVFTGSKTFSVAPAFSAAGAPFSVGNTTKVTSLNADLLDGFEGAAFSLTGHTHDAGAIVSGTIADVRLSSNIPKLNAANIFTAAPSVVVPTQTVANLNSSSTGGTWLNFQNSGASGRTWNLITTSTANSEGPGKLLVRDQTANAVRMTIDPAGRVGIGTTAPAAPLDVQVAAGQTVQVRLDSLVPGININNTGGNAGIMRLRNAVEVWPSDDGTRAAKVDIRNTAGNPTVVLDGASGNATYTNQPAIASTQTFRDPRNFQLAVRVTNTFRDIDTLSMTVPAAGFLLITATINTHIFDPSPNVSDSSAYFKLEETTSGNPVMLVETRASSYGDLNPQGISVSGSLTLSWVIPVSGPGVRSFKTVITAQGSVDCYTSTLNALFVPRGM